MLGVLHCPLGEYKRVPSVVGGHEAVAPEHVPAVPGQRHHAVQRARLDKGGGRPCHCVYAQSFTKGAVMEGRSTGGELVACVNEVPEPAALRGLHRLDDLFVLIWVMRWKCGSSRGRSLRCSPVRERRDPKIRRTGSTLPRSSVTERTCMDLTDCQAAVTAGAAAESTATR